MEDIRSIAIDWRSVVYGSWHRGIGHYARNLVIALAEARPNMGITLITSGEEGALEWLPNFKTEYQNIDEMSTLELAAYNFQVYHIPDPCSIYTGLNNPFLSRPRSNLTSCTFFDSIPNMGFPGGAEEWSAPLKHEYHQRLLDIVGSRYNDLIFPISDTAREQLPLCPQNAIVAEPGIDSLYAIKHAEEPNPIVQKLIKNKRPYLLTVGGLDPHKSPGLMCELFFCAKSRIPDLKWVIAGKRSQWHDALQLDNQPGVIILDFVDSDDLTELYKHAIATCMPSKAEGLGLPAYEAALAGGNVLTSDIPSFRDLELPRLEFGIKDWLDAILAIANCSDAYSISAKNAAEIRAKYNWKRCAETMLDAWSSKL